MLIPSAIVGALFAWALFNLTKFPRDVRAAMFHVFNRSY